APVALAAAGATLEGTISYGGEQLHYAQIQVSGGGKVATGTIGEDGRYKVENAPTGEVTIGVNPKAAMSRYQTDVMQGGAMTGGPEGKAGRKKTAVKFTDIPEQFYEPDKSGLKTTVNKGSNTYDIVIPKGSAPKGK
ncbi:MAG: hypothetical protein ABGY75_18720, partial [Gemmataceae bacterium]